MELRKREGKETGFTLIEITIAVLILSVSLITMLGLQSSIVKRTLRDEGKQQAMLIARSILSAIEIQTGEIQIMDKTAPAEEILKTFITLSPNEDEEERNTLFNFLARIKIEDWNLPKIEGPALRKVTLSIFEEAYPEDAFNLVYFVPYTEE